MEIVYLSRRNLQTLLNKLDRTKSGDPSHCTIIKRDNKHEIYPQTMDKCMVKAVEDEDYYINRPPGGVLDYEIKPTNEKELQNAIKKIIEQYEDNTQSIVGAELIINDSVYTWDGEKFVACQQ